MALRACGRAQSARASESDGAPGQAVCRAWVSGNTDAYTHIGAGGRRDRLSTFEILDPISESPRSLWPKLISITGDSSSDGYRLFLPKLIDITNEPHRRC
jgi:hypothetical protein